MVTDDLRDALKCYEVARLTFRSLANDLAHRLALGEPISDEETRDSADAFAAVVMAYRRLRRAAEAGGLHLRREPNDCGKLEAQTLHSAHCLVTAS